MASKRNSLSPCRKCGNLTRDQRGGLCDNCAFPGKKGRPSRKKPRKR